jgi:hypothetical protein
MQPALLFAEERDLIGAPESAGQSSQLPPAA